MSVKLKHLWEVLTTSYWFVPAVMTGLAVGLGIFTLCADRALVRQEQTGGWLYSGGPEGFVPHLSVTLGVLMAMVCMAVLIYFIHHVCWSLQAPSVVAAAASDLDRSIGQLENDGPDGQQHNVDDVRADSGLTGSDCATIDSHRDGYVQVIDYREILRRAAAADVRIWLDRRPGDFVICGTPLAHVQPAHACTAELQREVQKFLLFGAQPTPEQDLEYAIRQMVEVAVRALSPGINDPFTAINCIDALGAALCRIADNPLPPARYHDSKGTVRVIARTVTFASIVDTSFSLIRQYGRSSPAVLIRLLDVIAQISPRLNRPDQRQALLRHTEMICQDGQETIPREQDRQDLRQRYDSARVARGSPEARTVTRRKWIGPENGRR